MNACPDRVSREEFLAAAQVLMQGLAQLMGNEPEPTPAASSYSVKEAYEVLGCESLKHVYNLFHAGKIEGYRVGRKGIRLYKDSVQEFVKANSNIEGGVKNEEIR